MNPRKTISAILSLAMVAALAAPATAGYVERSIRAVAAEPPLPAEQASRGDMSPGACWRHPDDVLVHPATGVRSCEAASMSDLEGASAWLGGPRPSAGANPAPDMSPEACWRHPDDVLVNPATGLRNCAE